MIPLRRVLLIGGLVVAAFLFSSWLNAPDLDPDPIAPATLASPTTEQVRAGDYLVKVGNCAGCHSAPGAPPFSGGKAIETPFGAVYGSNLTPDPDTGLGLWTTADFYRAMRHGRSKDGGWLSPAFPYTSYTHLTRADSDAIFAWLQTLPPVQRAQPPPTLRPPFDLSLATRVWRALYFRPARDAEIAAMGRGQYLVEGLGHCSECHTPRGRLGGPLAGSRWMGGSIPGLGWDALPLAGLDREDDPDGHELAALLKTGVDSRRAVAGPMAEVVFHSLQHLRDDDLVAVVDYLRRLPAAEPPPAARVPQVSADDKARLRRQGGEVYAEHCADCHGRDGEGQPRQFPALAGSRLVNAVSATNALRLTLHGGYPPSTDGNPFPYGMPPFSHTLSRDEIAAVLTYIRSEWGNDAPAVSVVEVERR